MFARAARCRVAGVGALGTSHRASVVRRRVPPCVGKRSSSSGGARFAGTRRVVLRVVAAPYALLSLVPMTSSALAAYHAASGRADEARGCAFFAVTGFLSLPLSVVMFAAAPFTLLCDADRRRLPDLVQKAWGRATTRCFYETRVDGLEKLAALERDSDGRRAAVYVSNHCSWLDIYALFEIDALPLKIVAKKEIFLIPLCGWVMYLIGHIPLDRKKGGKGVLNQCADLIDRDCPVFFFPEGTRSRDGALQPFKPGAFVLAARKDVPVVPITILGTAKLMPPGNEFWQGGKLTKEEEGVRIIIHDPIYPSRDAPDVVGDLSERTRRAIAAGLPPDLP